MRNTNVRPRCSTETSIVGLDQMRKRLISVLNGTNSQLANPSLSEHLCLFLGKVAEYDNAIKSNIANPFLSECLCLLLGIVTEYANGTKSTSANSRLSEHLCLFLGIVAEYDKNH